jgi:hypothetical protein
LWTIPSNKQDDQDPVCITSLLLHAQDPERTGYVKSRLPYQVRYPQLEPIPRLYGATK